MSPGAPSRHGASVLRGCVPLCCGALLLAAAAPPDAGADSLEWALGLIPELAQLSPQPDRVDFSPLGSVGGRVVLWAPERIFSNVPAGRSRACRKVTFAIDEGSLHAEVPLGGGPGQPELKRSGSFEELQLGGEATVYGPHSREVSRDGKEVGLTASPVANTVGASLSRVTKSEVVYGAVRVTATAVCATWESTACREGDGAEGACRRCTRLGARLHSLSPDHGFGRGPALTSALRREGESLPLCADCPADELSALVPRLDAALKGRIFLSPTPPLVFHRTRAGCERAAREE